MSKSFVQLVAAMRQAQKRYFKERTQSALKEAKQLEREVDAQIDEFRAENERLRAAFGAHHPPNLQEGYRCDVCGEDHPYALAAVTDAL